MKTNYELLTLVTEEVTTIKTPLTEDGVQKKPTAEIATVEDPRILIEDGVQTEPITSRVLDALSSIENRVTPALEVYDAAVADTHLKIIRI